MKTPVRWLDDPTLAGDLRADLQCVQEHAWQPDLDRAAASLDAALTAEVNPSGVATRAATSGSHAGALLSKLVVAAVGGGLMISAGIWQLHRPTAVQPSESGVHEPALPEGTPSTGDALEPAGIANNTARREIEQLQRIYATLERDPAQAYRLARASLEQIPHGPLREEREGLAVIALWQSGEHVPARALAQRFLAQYPESPLRERIRELLASEPSP